MNVANSWIKSIAPEPFIDQAEEREQLILSHLPLVKFVVGRMGYSQVSALEYNDLVNQGVLGLIDAVDQFNPGFGTQLSTYATLKIRSKILDYLRELDWMPRTTRSRVKKVQEAITSLEKKLHRVPSDQEIAVFMGTDEEMVQKTLVDCSRTIVSLDVDDQFDQTEGEGIDPYEKLVDSNQVDPSEQYENREFQTYLIKKMKSLSEREQLVLSLYYYDGLTFREIGEVLDISESRVCQIHGKAIYSLRAMLS